MAHFIGYVKGNRGEASRLGTKASGIDATARGWNIGGSVDLFHSVSNDSDRVRLVIDGGSNNTQRFEVLEVVEKDGKYEVVWLATKEAILAWLNQ